MNPTPAFEELAIALIAPNLNFTHLTPDFLFYSGIVPNDWKLAEPPQRNSHMAKIAFSNGSIVTVNHHAIAFSETLESKALSEIQVPTIVCKYIDTLPNADYQAVEINPSIFVTFEGGSGSLTNHYIASALLSNGTWLEFGSHPVRATLQLAYTVKGRQLNLKIDDVLLRKQDNKPQFAALFSGNFSYSLAGGTSGQRTQQLHRLIDNWRDDLKTFQELVNQRFFGLSVY